MLLSAPHSALTQQWTRRRTITIDFYDVEYDADIDVSYISDLSPKEQAEMLVQKPRVSRNIFSEEKDICK